MKEKRKSVQVHTRYLDRLVAHVNMKKKGIKHINKHDHSSFTTFSGMTVTQIVPSYFARHWRDYTTSVPVIDLRR